MVNYRWVMVEHDGNICSSKKFKNDLYNVIFFKKESSWCLTVY